MTRGSFRSFCHDHFFEVQGAYTVMKDVMQFEAPLGVFGSFVEAVFLKPHMFRLLIERNNHIRHVAESGEWQRYLPTGA